MYQGVMFQKSSQYWVFKVKALFSGFPKLIGSAKHKQKGGIIFLDGKWS